jgi:hypothetical protein
MVPCKRACPLSPSVVLLNVRHYAIRLEGNASVIWDDSKSNVTFVAAKRF